MLSKNAKRKFLRYGIIPTGLETTETKMLEKVKVGGELGMLLIFAYTNNFNTTWTKRNECDFSLKGSKQVFETVAPNGKKLVIRCGVRSINKFYLATNQFQLVK